SGRHASTSYPPGAGPPGRWKQLRCTGPPEPLRQQVEAKGWADERLKAMILQAVALHGHGDWDEAVQVLVDALALAQAGGFVRSFVDEGMPMAELLSAASDHARIPDAIGKLLAVFEVEKRKSHDESVQCLIEPLSH